QIVFFLIGDDVLEERARLVRFALQTRNWSVLCKGNSAASRKQGRKKNGSRPLHSQGNGERLRQPLVLDSTPGWIVAPGFQPDSQAQYLAVALTKGVGYCGTVPYGEPAAASPGLPRGWPLAPESP